MELSTLVILLVAAHAFGQLTTIPTDESRFTLYQMPTRGAAPCDLETGSDGHIYVSDQGVNKIAEINPTTGQVSEYTIPWTLPPLNQVTIPDRINLACAIRMGADGHLYASNGLRNQLVQFNISTKQIKVLTPPGLGLLGDLQPFNDLYTGPDGMYFTQTTGNVLTYYEYKTGTFTNYPIPTPAAFPLGVFYASDDNVHVSLLVANKLAKFNPRAKNFTEYPIPSPEFPAVVRVETQGRYVWHTGILGSSLVRYDMKTDQVKVFKYPIPGSFVAEDTLDPNGNIWISTFFMDTIAYFTPCTEKWTRIILPDGVEDLPYGVPLGVNVPVHYDQGTYAIWFAQERYNRVGMYKLDGTEGEE